MLNNNPRKIFVLNKNISGSLQGSLMTDLTLLYLSLFESLTGVMGVQMAFGLRKTTIFHPGALTSAGCGTL